MDDVSLLRVHEGEWRALRDLRLRALADSPDSFRSTREREALYSEAEWREWAGDSAEGASETCLLAWDGERPVAMAGAYVEGGSRHAHLIAMWVAPEARRRGIGELLVAAIVGWAADAGVASVRLDVVEGNAGARRLYERCRFVPTGRSRRYDDRPHLVAAEFERSTQ